MKNFRIASLLFIGVLFLSFNFFSCNDDDNDSTIVELTLTENEKANLAFMREEEKLARDVYNYLFDLHDINIFNNIASSEQTHMDAVLTKMIKYGVTDPASTEAGVFTNPDLQELYNTLIAQGEISLVEALKVGATIEDVDIKDLGDAIAATDNASLISLYEKLTCGSRNHLRGFTDRLDDLGETYSPQFITVQQYEDILNGSHENCGG